MPEDHVEVVTSSIQPQNHDLKIRYAKNYLQIRHEMERKLELNITPKLAKIGKKDGKKERNRDNKDNIRKILVSLF